MHVIGSSDLVTSLWKFISLVVGRSVAVQLDRSTMFVGLGLIPWPKRTYSNRYPLLPNLSFDRIMEVLKIGVKDITGLFRQKDVHFF